MKKITNNSSEGKDFHAVFGTEHPRQKPTLVTIPHGTTAHLEDELWADVVELLAKEGKSPETYDLEVSEGGV